MKKDFLSLFRHAKPVLGMLHLMGHSEQDVLKRAWREAQVMSDFGVDGVIVENYFGTPAHVRTVLEDFQKNRVPFVYGVNLLDDDAENFKLACRYEAAFLQLDSVAGHLTPEEDAPFGAWLDAQRSSYDGFVIGGVWFKYQPYRSGRTLKEDLSIGCERCDAIAVTGEGTGVETPIEKIKQYRDLVGNFPLIAAAGVTPKTCASQLAVADAAIVGSYFKQSHNARDEVCPENVRELMRVVNEVRQCL